MLIFRKATQAILAVIAVLALSGEVSAETYKGETAGVGDPVYTIFVAFANQARKAGVDIQVNAGQTLSKSMLKGARGEIDFFSTVPSLVQLMANQKRMFEKVEGAPELAKKLRGIVGFEAGAFHPVTLEGSGIETWADLKGKTVFTGPPAAAASATAEDLIRIITGYEPDKDYTAVRLSWGEGFGALSDGKVDMMIRPAEIGSSKIEQFGLSGKFRILSIPQKVLESEAMQALLKQPGRGLATFDGSVYKGQLTEGKITALSFNQFIGTNAEMSEDVVYKSTKAFWDNIGEVQATAAFLKNVTKDTAFTSMNVPLHPGALRYYEEAGFDVPANLR